MKTKIMMKLDMKKKRNYMNEANWDVRTK